MIAADRVKETTTTTGTGTYSLAGASAGFQSFVSGIGDGEQVAYCVTDDIDWEVGVGTVTDAAPDTLSRDVVLGSSNSGSAVNWGAGTKNVFLTLPAAQASAVGVSVKSFGAVGDGSNDDTAEIQAAIDYVEALGGGTVLIPEGTYLISSYVTIDTDRVSLIGRGLPKFTVNASVNTDAVSGDPGVIFISGANDCLVEGIEVDGTGATSSTGIKIRSGSRNTIRRCVTRNHVSTSTQSGYGIWVSGGSNTSQNTIEGNRSYDNGYSGIDVAYDNIGAATGQPTDNKVIGNHSSGNANDGYDIYETVGTRVIGCDANSNGRGGIFFTSENGAGANARGVISGNRCTGNTNSSYGGIVLNGPADNVTITGNVCHGNSHGIRFISTGDGSATSCVVAGNCTEDNTTANVTLTGTLHTLLDQYQWAIQSRDLGAEVAGPSITLGRNSNATTPVAGTIELVDRSGTSYFLWMDDTGDLRVHTAAPTTAASDTDGTVVGAQN